MASKYSIKSVAWQLLMITTGALVFSFGAKAILVNHNFIIGGFYGTCLMIHYATGWLSPGILFFIASAPVLILAYFFFSSRFFWYTLWAVIVITVASELIVFDLHIKDQLYAAVAGGVVCGAGGGIVLRSLGSCGGLDMIALMINRKYNIGVGKIIMIYNTVLFTFALVLHDIDLVIASLILTAISSGVLEYVLALFSQRKIVYILSNSTRDISQKIWQDLKQGATILEAKGAYSGEHKDMLMTITNNLQLKRLEDKVFSIDPNALFIVENSFNVIGMNFSKRKLY